MLIGFSVPLVPCKKLIINKLTYENQGSKRTFAFLTCVQPFTGGGLQGISHVGVQNQVGIPADPLFIGVCRGCGVFFIFWV